MSRPSQSKERKARHLSLQFIPTVIGLWNRPVRFTHTHNFAELKRADRIDGAYWAAAAFTAESTRVGVNLAVCATFKSGATMAPLRKALELTHAAYRLPGHIVASLKNGGVTMVYGVKTTEGNAASRGGAAYRIATGIAVAEALVLLWMNAAVGIIGDGPVNLLYLGVLLVGFVGAFIARFEPRGMALALFATAMAQILVPIVALVIWHAGWHDLLIDPSSPNPPFHPGIAPFSGLNAAFAGLWILSAWVFRQAARGRARSGSV